MPVDPPPSTPYLSVNIFSPWKPHSGLTAPVDPAILSCLPPPARIPSVLVPPHVHVSTSDSLTCCPLLPGLVHRLSQTVLFLVLVPQSFSSYFSWSLAHNRPLKCLSARPSFLLSAELRRMEPNPLQLDALLCVSVCPPQSACGREADSWRKGGRASLGKHYVMPALRPSPAHQTVSSAPRSPGPCACV